MDYLYNLRGGHSTHTTQLRRMASHFMFKNQGLATSDIPTGLQQGGQPTHTTQLRQGRANG